MAHFSIFQIEIIESGLDHPECVNFGPDGRLYAGGYAGQIYVMPPPKFELNQICSTNGFVLGIALDRNHNVYACDPKRHSVLKVTQNGTISTYCDHAPDGPVDWPNYGLFDSEGNFYFSDSGNIWTPNGRLVRVKPNGQAESLIGGNWHFPNGLALSPKEDAIFMIESTAADVLRIPINADGTVGQPEIYAQFQNNNLDGLTFAASGNLYVSCYYPNRIFIVTPDRNIEPLIEDTTGEILNQPTNLAFEPHGTRLFIASLAGSNICALDVGERGAPLNYPALRRKKA
ncbi:MAG TPA: SMP-30/gluconolactonase/LRE family protein [Candidatus Bathyarchaeia archaeon]|nr:SMP-30/gluconolactonase/LRE family protein [Candidatus Bathyarchaeia archaeon]